MSYPQLIHNIPFSLVCTIFCCNWNGVVYGPVHKGANHVPKAVSDRNPLPDWVRDLNYMYVRSQALQLPSRTRTGSAHCEVIVYSYCADWPICMASARILHLLLWTGPLFDSETFKKCTWKCAIPDVCMKCTCMYLELHTSCYTEVKDNVENLQNDIILTENINSNH